MLILRPTTARVKRFGGLPLVPDSEAENRRQDVRNVSLESVELWHYLPRGDVSPSRLTRGGAFHANPINCVCHPGADME